MKKQQKLRTRLRATKSRLAAFLLAATAATGAWAATLSYSGYISTDSANPTTVFSGVNLSDIGSTYVLKGNMGGGWVSTAGDAGVYNASNDGTTLTVQFQKIDGSGSEVYTKCVVVKFTQDGDNIKAYASATGASSTLTLGQAFSNASGTPASGASADGYGIYDVSLVAGRKVEYKNTGTTSGTYTISGGQAAQPTWKMNIPAKGAATSGALVKVKAIKIGSRTSTWNTSYDSAYVKINDVESTHISTYATPYLLAWNSATTCKPLEYVFPDATPLMVNVGTEYDANFYYADGTQTSKNPGGSYLIQSANNVEYALWMPNVLSAGWRPVQEVETLVVATATASADANWSALTWTNGAADWTAAGATPVVLAVSENCTITLDSAVSLESIVFEIADGKTLTLVGSNTLTAANGIIIKGGTVAVANTSTLSGTLYGNGTLSFSGVYGTALSNIGVTATSADWRGTVSFSSVTAKSGWKLKSYGSANSTIRFDGITDGYFNDKETFDGTVDIGSGGLTLHYGNGGGTLTTITTLTGSGEFKITGGSTYNGGCGVCVKNIDGFTGKLTLSQGCNQILTIGTTGATGSAGKIVVANGATATAKGEWSAAGGLEVSGTLTVNPGATVPTIKTTDTAAYVFQSSATIGTVSGSSIGSSLGIMSGTVSVTDTAITSLTIPAETGFTYVNSGTLDLSGCTSLTALYLNLGASLMVDMTKITLPSGCTVYANAGSVRDLSNYSVSGATYLVEETKAEYGAGSLTVENVPTGASVAVRRVDGTIVSATVEGTTATLTGAAKISGAATDLDWDFTDGENDAFEQAPSGMGKSQDSSALTFYTDANDSTKTGVYIKNHPYTSGAASWFTQNSAAMTVAVVGTMPATKNTIFLNFGSAYVEKYGLLIATTANDNEVLIGYNYGGTVTPITTMTVPNASSSRHSYIVTKVDGATATTFTVYLDGTKWKTVTTDAATLGAASDVKVAFTGDSNNGIQVGSDYGGNIRNAAVYSAASDDVGILNVLRAYGRVITQAEIDAYAAAFPYDSPSGKSTRTFTAASENWIDETENSAVWSNTKSGNASGTPDAGAQLEVTASAASAQTIAVNLASQASYESLLVEGTQTVTFQLADGYAGAIAPGKTTIKTPVIVKPGVLNLSGGPTFVEGDGHLTFDYSGYTMTGTSAIELTGEMDRNDSAVTITPPADQHYTYTYGYSGTQYVITPTVAVAVLDHGGDLTGYTSIAEAVAAAEGGDTITLQTTELTPSTLIYTATGEDKSRVTFVIHGVEVAAVYDGSADTTWTTDAYYHWTGEGGADTNWTTPANWGLASGYPGSTVRNASNYYNTNDAVYFGADAEVSVDSDRYAASITLANSAKVTFTGGGSIKTGYNNNSGSIQLLGSGEVHMKGIKFVLPYNTRGNESATIEVPIVVEPCEAENNIYLATGSTGRNSKLTLATALQGSGNITFGAGTFSQTTLALTGDLSAFSGTATVSAKIAALPVGGTGTWVISSDDVANAITSISFTGGTLSLPAAVTTDVSAKIAAGTHTAPVKVATASNTEWSAGAINGSYGFVKSGAGTLTLTQAPTYTGATTVSEGILVVPVGTTFNGTVTIAEGAKIQFEADPTWADGSTPTICTFTTAPDADTLSRIEITGFGGRQFATLNYDSVTGEYVATVTSPTLVWNGADGANWGDTDVWLVGGEATTYMSGDKVSFPDSLFTGETTELTVNVGADVEPVSITIAPGAGHTYKFTGTGKVTTADLVVAATGAGTVKLAADVFSGLEIETAGMVTVAAGEGAVTLAKVTSSSDSTALTVSSGSLTLTEGLGCIIKNDATLILDGTFNLNKTITGTSANAELIIRGTIDRTQNGNYEWLNSYAGKFVLEEGATYKYLFRNTNNTYAHKNLFGNGAVELEGGTVASLDGASPQEVFPANSVNVPDGATVTFERRTGNADRATRLVLSGTLTGSGTMNSDRTLALGCTDATGFAGTVNWTHTYASTVNNITAATATSADATYNVSGAPASATQLIGLNFSGTAEMGAFNVSSANAQVGVNNANVELEIGAKADSTINGQFITNPLTITKVGDTTLTLGSAFAMPSGSTIAVTEGKLVTAATTFDGVNFTFANGTESQFTVAEGYEGATSDWELLRTTGTITLTGSQSVTANGSTATGYNWSMKVGTVTENEVTYNVLYATASQIATWTGNGDDDNWDTVGNWDTGVVPTQTTPVVFPAGDWTAVITGWGTAKCASMTVTGNLTLAQSTAGVDANDAGNPYNLDLYGSVAGEGTVTLSNAGIWNGSGDTITFKPSLVVAVSSSNEDSQLCGSQVVFNGEVDIQGRLWTKTSGHVFNGATTIQWLTADNARVVFNGDVTLNDGSYVDNYGGYGWQFNGVTVTALGENGAVFYNGNEVEASVTGSGVTFVGKNVFNTWGEAVPVISAPAVLKSGATVRMMNSGTITTYSAETANHAVEVSADGSYQVYTCVIPQANAPAIDLREETPVVVTTSGESAGVTLTVDASSLKAGLYYRVKMVDGAGNVTGTEKVLFTGENASALNLTAPLPAEGVLYYTIEASDSAN